MDLLILKRDSQAWEWAWNWVAIHPINEGLTEPIVALNEGETWQYMGSVTNKGKTLSSFKHNNHPKTNEAVNLTVEHTEPLTVGDIEVTKPVK